MCNGKFLHNHPAMERDLLPDNKHVIVDRDHWQAVMNFLQNSNLDVQKFEEQSPKVQYMFRCTINTLRTMNLMFNGSPELDDYLKSLKKVDNKSFENEILQKAIQMGRPEKIDGKYLLMIIETWITKQVEKSGFEQSRKKSHVSDYLLECCAEIKAFIRSTQILSPVCHELEPREFVRRLESQICKCITIHENEYKMQIEVNLYNVSGTIMLSIEQRGDELKLCHGWDKIIHKERT